MKTTRLLCDAVQQRKRKLCSLGGRAQTQQCQPPADSGHDVLPPALIRRPSVEGRARPGRVILFLASLALQAGTATGALAAQRPWCETRTDAFTVITDLRQTDLDELLLRLERLDAVAQPLLPGTAVLRPAPLKLIVFSSRNDLRRHLGTGRFAGVMQPSLKTHRLLIGPDQRSTLETAQHEYAHYLLRSRLDISLPTWYDEGLASLLGAVTYEAGAAVVGELPRKRMEELFYRDPRRRIRPLTLQETLAAVQISDWAGDRMRSFYHWSWLLTHYLYFPPEALAVDTRGVLTAYLSDRNGRLTEYLDTSVRDLQRALEVHLRKFDTPRRVELPADSRQSARSIRCLSDQERDFELALATLAHNPAHALKLLEPQLAERAEDPELLVAQSRAHAALGESAIALALAESAYSREPLSASSGDRNLNAMVNFADRLVDDCLQKVTETCRAAWRRAASLYRDSLREDPDRIDAVFGLGLSYLHSGRPGDAVNYLQVAYQRVPWASVVNFYLGEGYRLIGDTRARTYLTNARNWAPDLYWQKLADLALERLGAAEPSDR
ncbi:MAG: hypothetical protein R3E82_11820 [Pseudomonadales bacterium]